MPYTHRKMEFVVVRYAPPHGQINVGVVLFEKVQDCVTFAEARFVQDFERVKGLDPRADVVLLESLFRDIECRLRDPADRAKMLHTIQDSFSNILQVSENKSIVTCDDPTVELEMLASFYISSPRPSN